MPETEASQLEYQSEHRSDTQQPKILAVLCLSLVISYAAVLLRLVSRRLKRAQLWIDDWVIISSLVKAR